MMKASVYRRKTMFRRKYRYFISYTAKDKDGDSILGNAGVTLERKIKTMQDIRDCGSDIGNKIQEIKEGTVIILNYQRLRG